MAPIGLLVGCAAAPPPRDSFALVDPPFVQESDDATEPDVAPEAPQHPLSAVVLPDATTVAIVHPRRMLELGLNPLVLLLVRKYVEDECALHKLMGIERVIVSLNDSGWVAVIDGRDAARDMMTCLGESPLVTKKDFRAGAALELHGVIAVDHDGALVLGGELPLGRLLGPRKSNEAAQRVLALLPDKSDALVAVGSHEPIGGAASASSGFIAGDLDHLQFHSESTVGQSEWVDLVQMLPVLRLALRPVLAEVLAKDAKIDTVLKALDQLHVERDGDKLILDLPIDDVTGLIDALTP
jgi:hypothetical protein